MAIQLKKRPEQDFSEAKETNGECVKPFSRAFLCLVLSIFSGAVLAQSPASKVSLENAHANAIVVESNPLNSNTNYQDSLTERGSYNFSDMGSWIWGAKTMNRSEERRVGKEGRS